MYVLNVIDTLSTHYTRIIYALSVLRSYLKGALSEIRGFKRLDSWNRLGGWFCDNNFANRLKCFLNQVQGGVGDVANDGFVNQMLKSKFSAPLMLLFMRSFGTVFGQSHSKQNYVLQGTVISAVE